MSNLTAKTTNPAPATTAQTTLMANSDFDMKPALRTGISQ
ncbi:hypothetical protein CVCC1112_4264 [Paenarthrobacter nicotinovorans]|nr:hypothetical protein CVCC1112_4264 [Paenarthrobacter nicotinovorans]